MAYATPLDVLAAWPRTHTTALTHDELRTLIDRAGHVIDAALARRYSVPLCTDPSQAPGIIRDLTVDLAMLDALDRAPNAPEWIVRRSDRIRMTLEALADGSISLPGIGEQDAVGTIRSNTSGYTPVFGGIPTLDEGYDPDRARDEAGARGLHRSFWE